MFIIIQNLSDVEVESVENKLRFCFSSSKFTFAETLFILENYTGLKNMKVKFVRQFIGLSFISAFALLSFSCQTAQNQSTANQEAVKANTPSDAYRMLYAAVKAKNNARIQQMMSRDTIAFAGFAMQQNKEPLEKIFENGLTATTFADTLPEIRDERVNGNFGAVEVYSQKDNRWEDLPFVLEDGGWKLAVGDSFKGTYKSPGKGQAQLEMEANNPMTSGGIPSANSNGNADSNNNSFRDKSKRNPVNTAEVPDESATKAPAKTNKK